MGAAMRPPKTLLPLLGLSAACIALALSACHPKPPPPPPAPPPPVAEAPPPPPPAPPRCEALGEGCTGQAGTVARIRKTGFGVAVPLGWTYAQQDDATVVNAGNAAFAVTTYEGADAKTASANRDSAFDALVKLLAVTAPKHKVTWSHAAKKSKVGDLEMSLWQTDDVARADKKGPVLVFGAQLPDKSFLLGAGFVSDDDKSDADKAILGAIDSISPAPATPAPQPPPAATP